MSSYRLIDIRGARMLTDDASFLTSTAIHSAQLRQIERRVSRRQDADVDLLFPCSFGIGRQ